VAAAGATEMRAPIVLAAAALLLAGCETAFVGRAPSGRFTLAEVDGRAVPPAPASPPACAPVVHNGWFELDSIARRFELYLQHRNSCTGAVARETRESGSYLRDSGRLMLEAVSADGETRRWTGSELGRQVNLTYEGDRLTFRQPRP